MICKNLHIPLLVHITFQENKMRTTREDFDTIGTERINLLTDFVCSVYGLNNHELADKLGVNRGWLTRMRKGSIGDWSYLTVTGIAELALNIDAERLFAWICCEETNYGNTPEQLENEPISARISPDESE